MSVVVAADSPLTAVDDVPAGLRVASTGAPDVECICRILLEPADLDPANLRLTTTYSYTLVAKAILRGEVDAGFFLRTAYDDLSAVVRAGAAPAGLQSHLRGDPRADGRALALPARPGRSCRPLTG